MSYSGVVPGTVSLTLKHPHTEHLRCSYWDQSRPIVTNLFTQGDLLRMMVTDTSRYVDIFYSTYDYLSI